MAFSDYESKQIRTALLREARKCGATIGVRKTSVEQLTEAAGISKGSFYKFFDSKELLFFSVLENIHTEIYEIAKQALAQNADIPPHARAEKALIAACKQLSDTDTMTFIENDAEFLLRRLPEAVKQEHYHDDETHIRELLSESGLSPSGGMALATATILGLILTVSHQQEIGVCYPEVLGLLIRGAMKDMFPQT